MSTHLARKRFGQNFLIDNGVIADILRAVAPQANDNMVEIGPGLGALTNPLLETLTHLHVVELDRDLVARLHQGKNAPRLTIHEGDALAFDFSTLATEQPLRVIGNLPYNISTPLLFHLASYAAHLRDMHFMLQKEVVERMAAPAGSSAYGRLSVMLQYYCYVEHLFDVPPTAFRPAPKVDSAIVRLIPKPAHELHAQHPLQLALLVRQAFSQRRKMLRNTLKDMVDDDSFAAANIDSRRRAEDLSMDEFVCLSNTISKAPTENNGADDHLKHISEMLTADQTSDRY